MPVLIFKVKHLIIIVINLNSIKSTFKDSRRFITVINQWFRVFNTAKDKRVGAHEDITIPACDLPFGADLKEQEQVLNNITSIFEVCKLFGKEERKIAPFMQGILLNCAALPMLYDDMKKMFPDHDIKIFTSRLNSDTAERFFSQMRGARANNPNPNSTDFKYRFRSYLLGSNPDETILGFDTNVRAGEDDPVSMRQQVLLILN